MGPAETLVVDGGLDPAIADAIAVGEHPVLRPVGPSVHVQRGLPPVLRPTA